VSPVWVGESDTNGGGDRGGVRWSGSRISCQDQPVDRSKNAGGAPGHHRVDVPGFAVWMATGWYTGGSRRSAGTSGPRAWPTHGGDRRRRGRRSAPGSSTRQGRQVPR
jgi:hypothetical protein